jgi:hypothetical protein
VENSHLVGSHSVLAVFRIPYGKSGMQDILKIMKSQKTGSKTFWSNHSLIGRGLLMFLVFLILLNLWIFVIF